MNATVENRGAPWPWRVVLAFATIYLVWGTTYFVVGEVVHAWPPLLMSSARFLVAGTVLYAWRRTHGAPAPTRENWIAAAWVSVLLLLCGYGVTAWAQKSVPSGLTALIVSMTPLVMVAIEWLRPGGRRPAALVLVGLGMGLTGMLLLVGPSRLDVADEGVPLLPTLACAFASLCWATGSVLGRQARQSRDALLSASMQMLLGCVWLGVAGLLTGELEAARTAPLSLELFGGWLYLTIAGSLGAYTAYIYLLEVSTPARVSTYAYVNPAVAVFVGWLLGGEVVTSRMGFAGALLLGGVMLITLRRPRK
jgi:drug/metabolite transporter (DMT)-like permease